MKGIPLIEINDPALIVRGYNLGLKVAANVPQVLTLEQLEHYERNLPELQDAIRRGLTIPGKPESRIEVAEPPKAPAPEPLILSATGGTFAEWLGAREKIHTFLTGETVILRDMFVVNDQILARTDIMPVFRPVGVTNRMALDWKVKLGMNPSYEEDANLGGVMRYRNCEGPEVPQLGFINRSVRPDKNTLGDDAKSPDGLLTVHNAKWLNLYGWSDADNLHFLITGQHLDSEETLTWFPDDRLPGGEGVARGGWFAYDARAYFDWYYGGHCFPRIGARLAKALSLRKP